MPRRGENIYKRKDGRWEGRYIKGRSNDGKAIYGFIYARTYGEVRKKVLDAKQDIYEVYKSRDNPIFAIVAEQWIEYVKFNTKKSTIVKYKNLLKNHIIPILGYKRISDIDTHIVENFIMDKLENGRLDGTGGLSTKTVKDILSIIKEILIYAQRHNLKSVCNIDGIRIKSDEKSLSILNAAEQAVLEEYIYKNMSLKNLGILTSLYMGLRIGELCALQWSDIDVDNGIMKISKTMQRLQNLSNTNSKKTDVVISSPKSDSSSRIIPIPEFLQILFKQYKTNDIDAYFLTGTSERFIEPRTYQYYFKKVLKENNIEQTNYHILRHTFATRCIENGFDIKSLSEILGHSSVKITLDRYVHSSMDLKRKNMLRISSPVFFKQSE